MRSYGLCLILLVSFINCRAQNGDSLVQAMINRRCNSVVVSIPSDQLHYPTRPPYRNIRVFDYRRDTLRIGMTTEEPSDQRQVRFAHSTASTIGAYLTAHYAGPGATGGLAVIIKDLWLSDPADPSRSGRRAWNFHIRLEGYLSLPEGYIPLAYYDTTITSERESLSTTVEHHLPEFIGFFMNKVADADIPEVIQARRVITFEQIDSFCNSRYRFPIERDSRLLKGVYANLEEFRNNRPSVTEYQLTKDKKGILELQIPDGNGRYVYTHTAWGICDGQQMFVMMDGNLFPIFILNHQFYVLGSKRYYTNNVPLPIYAPLGGGFAYGMTNITASTNRDLRIYPFDPETGAIGRELLKPDR